MSCLVALIGFLFIINNMYQTNITLNKKSKIVIMKKKIGDVIFQVRRQHKKYEIINIEDIQKELDEEINAELLLGKSDRYDLTNKNTQKN